MKIRVISLLLFGLMLSNSVAKAETIALDQTLISLIEQSKNEAWVNGLDLWPGFNEAPRGLLLTLPDNEVLLCHGSQVAGFNDYQMLDGLTCDAQQRPRQFPTNLLAAMPIAEGQSTIVIGTPDSTSQSPAAWIRSVFHEHFHQYQSSLPNYYERIDALALSNGDQTGMWMLNYAFPYKDIAFNQVYQKAAQQLLNLIQVDSVTSVDLDAYLATRSQLASQVSDQDWRYFEFQLWQEGIARWHELEMASRSRLSNVVDSGKLLEGETLDNLLNQTPAQVGRLAVYAFGASEGFLLERCSRNWREGYIAALDTASLVESIVVSDCD